MFFSPKIYEYQLYYWYQNIIINRKMEYISIKSCFFILLAVKYFEMFPKDNRFDFCTSDLSAFS